MHTFKLVGRVSFAVVFALGSLQAEEPPLKDTKDMKCPVDATEGCEGGYCSNKVKRNLFVEHEGRKVYFCCEGCMKSFKKDPKKYAVKVLDQWKVIDAKNEGGEEKE